MWYTNYNRLLMKDWNLTSGLLILYGGIIWIVRKAPFRKCGSLHSP